jgi:hypothetical protein
MVAGVMAMPLRLIAIVEGREPPTELPKVPLGSNETRAIFDSVLCEGRVLWLQLSGAGQ